MSKIKDRGTGWSPIKYFEGDLSHRALLLKYGEPSQYRELSHNRLLQTLRRELSHYRMKGQCTYFEPVYPFTPVFPLEPYSNLPSPKASYVRAAECAALEMLKKGMPWGAITSSVVPEFNEGFGAEGFYNKRPAKTGWATWAPYAKGRRRAKEPIINKISQVGTTNIVGAPVIRRYYYPREVAHQLSKEGGDGSVRLSSR